MKKLLIATTALVMTAGMASAEVKMTGDARFGLSYSEANMTNEWTTEYRLRAKFNFSGTTDGGLDFGASFILNGSAPGTRLSEGGVVDLNGDGDTLDTVTVQSDNTSDAVVWVGGSWGTVTVGEVDTGDDSVGLGLADIGYKGIGLDDVAESLYAGTSANINYTGTFGAITVALSYDLPVSQAPASDDWAIGVGYKGDGYTVALGYDSDEVLTIGGGATFGAISFNAMYSSDDALSRAAWGASASYKLNSATTITVAYADDDYVSTDASYGVNATYNLGGGAKLLAGIGSVDGVSEAEVGMTFTF